MFYSIRPSSSSNGISPVSICSCQNNCQWSQCYFHIRQLWSYMFSCAFSSLFSLFSEPCLFWFFHPGPRELFLLTHGLALGQTKCQARSYLLISGEPNDYNWVTKNKQSRVSRSHVHHQWLSQDKARFHIICQEVFTLPALLALELACLPPPDMFTLDWLCHHNLLMIVSDRLFSWFIYPCHLFLFFFVGSSCFCLWLLFSVCIFGNDNALIKCYSICMAAHCFVTLPPALALQCCHRMPLPHGCDGLHLCQNTMLLSHATLLHTVL